jgi:hypothetical protein
MEPEIFVFNTGGCHGHYLVYLIDRLSKKTPIITDTPFNSLGNSHKKLNYSGFVKLVDEHQDIYYKNLKNKKIIKITVSDEILYYERVAINRAADRNINLENMNMDISFLKIYNESFYKKIHELYSIDGDVIPKWMLRDVFKLGFLNWNKLGSVISLKQSIDWINKNLYEFNEIHFLDVSIFFTLDTLKNELKKLDVMFDLELKFDELEIIHNEFLKLNKILQTKKNTDIVLEAVKKNKNIDVPSLDIVQQAFIYSELEKKYNFITMPLVEQFFHSTKEIIDYVNLYPNHYKAMNPNLPMFNGIPNPFYLWNLKNKL